MKTKLTGNRGAQIERAAIRRKVKALISEAPNEISHGELSSLLERINTRAKRTDKRKGGLGRK